MRRIKNLGGRVLWYVPPIPESENIPLSRGRCVLSGESITSFIDADQKEEGRGRQESRKILHSHRSSSVDATRRDAFCDGPG